MSIGPPAGFIMGRVAFAGLGTALLALAGWITLRNLSLPSDRWLDLLGAEHLLAGHDGAAVLVDRTSSPSRLPGLASGRVGAPAGALARPASRSAFLVRFWSPRRPSLGPLLGILITGPGAFVLGSLAAALAWRHP